MKRKLENYDQYPKNIMLLLNPDIALKGNIFFYIKKKENKFYHSLFINKLY